MATVTPGQFRSEHPDLKTWMPADYESYEVLAESTGKTPQPVSAAWRQALKDPATQPLAQDVLDRYEAALPAGRFEDCNAILRTAMDHDAANPGGYAVAQLAAVADRVYARTVTPSPAPAA